MQENIKLVETIYTLETFPNQQRYIGEWKN
jgi:hypothetical protein